MLKKWIILFFTVALALTACHSPVYDQTEANVADVKLKAAAARKKSDDSGKPQPSLLVKKGDYVDTTPISLYQKPSWLKNHIEIRGDSLPFSYYSRTIARGAGTDILTKFQPGLDAAVRVSLNYSGTVEGALDLLATKAGYVYTINKDQIFWKAFITRTFDVAFMPGGTDYLMGKSSSGNSSSASSSSGSGTTSTFGNDSADAEYSSLSGKLSLWDDLKTTITQLLSQDGKVTVSQATTSVTVNDRPSNVELVEQYIRNLNKNMSKQVLVKIQILEVDLTNDYSFGINWDAIMHAFHNSPFVIKANYGTPIAITSFTPQPSGFTAPSFGTIVDPSNPNGIPSYNILFNALNQQGKTSVVSEPRVICLNNQVSVVRITESEGYVASVENTSTGAGGTTTAAQNTVTSQVTPGTLITGLTLYVLPKILGDKIYMQVNADLSTKIALQPFGSGSSTIQLPNVRAKHFNQRSVIHSGDTLILSGFRQVGNQARAQQMINSQALGGKASVQENSETVVLITPIVLPGSA